MNQQTMAREQVQQPNINNLRSTTRDFDALLLAQHQMIEERMASMNQQTTAHVQRPSFNLQPRAQDCDALSLAHHQTIGEPMASRQEFVAFPASLHYPTMLSTQHAPQTQSLGNGMFEQQSQLLSSAMGKINPQQQLAAAVGRPHMTEGGHNASICNNAPVSNAGYHNPKMYTSQHAPQTLSFGNNPYQKSQISSGIGGYVNLQQQPTMMSSHAARSVSFGNNQYEQQSQLMNSAGGLVHPHSVGGHPQQQQWQSQFS